LKSLLAVFSGGVRVGGAQGKTEKGTSDDVVMLSQPC